MFQVNGTENFQLPTTPYFLGGLEPNQVIYTGGHTTERRKKILGKLVENHGSLAQLRSIHLNQALL